MRRANSSPTIGRAAELQPSTVVREADDNQSQIILRPICGVQRISIRQVPSIASSSGHRDPHCDHQLNPTPLYINPTVRSPQALTVFGQNRFAQVVRYDVSQSHQ